MINEITIGVVIPFYSKKEWLEEAIESVLRQTQLPTEIIVVNDGSDENIDNIKEKYRDQVNFYYQTNKGVAVARNKGISICNCQYIMFLDSDDIWERNKIEIQINYMINNNYKWCATSYKTFGNCKVSQIDPYYSKELCWKHIYDTCRIQTSTVTIAKELLLENDFAEDMINGQDIYLWFKLANVYKLGVILQPLVKFRIRGNNAHLNYVTHIRVRALIWMKMMSKELLMPNHILTRIGYNICYRIYKKDNYKIKKNLKNKFRFLIAWTLFRIDALFTK